MKIKPVKFKYLNYLGEAHERTVTPDTIELLMDPGFNHQPGWFLSGWDHDKEAHRSFALTRIVVDSDQNPFWFRILLDVEE